MILSEYDRGDYMSDLFAQFPMTMWIIDAILWLLGIFFWGATYIGAPLESKKSGKHVSGLPGLAFLFFLGAGYMSQYRLLMLVALTDISVTMLPIMIFKEHINKKNKKEEKHENKIR